MARVTVKETTELALELGYTLKKAALGYTLIDSESKPQYSFRHLADMFSKLAEIALDRRIASITPVNADEMEWVTDEQKYAEMDAFNAQVDKETEDKWNAYCEEVRAANDLIESEGMSETYQKALSEVQGQYVDKMDNLYAEQAHSVAVQKLDSDLIGYKADTSIYSDLSSGFYWDNVNNTLSDKPRTCETCKHVSWEDGCDITSKHPMCKEVYDAIAAYESLYGEVDFKVAATCRGYEYHDHCDGEHELPGDFNQAKV